MFFPNILLIYYGLFNLLWFFARTEFKLEGNLLFGKETNFFNTCRISNDIDNIIAVRLVSVNANKLITLS